MKMSTPIFFLVGSLTNRNTASVRREQFVLKNAKIGPYMDPNSFGILAHN